MVDWFWKLCEWLESKFRWLNRFDRESLFQLAQLLAMLSGVIAVFVAMLQSLSTANFALGIAGLQSSLQVEAQYGTTNQTEKLAELGLLLVDNSSFSNRASIIILTIAGVFMFFAIVSWVYGTQKEKK